MIISVKRLVSYPNLQLHWNFNTAAGYTANRVNVFVITKWIVDSKEELLNHIEWTKFWAVVLLKWANAQFLNIFILSNAFNSVFVFVFFVIHLLEDGFFSLSGINDVKQQQTYCRKNFAITVSVILCFD